MNCISFNHETWDFVNSEWFKLDIDGSVADILTTQFLCEEMYLAEKEFARREAKAKIAAEKETQKALTILLSELSNLLNLITVARLFSALSLHALRKQKNINDRVVIAMTEKFTLVQLSSEKISYRHDATQ
jgi:hypothetical protein